ncbi:uncharacterized protein LOC133459342 [Cololabis saira]|uniref:uncharacterized protein LOC133459342 n=1 Tax=Cololabis saira TaxID=129043 RepID=UPI002AD3D657|nr:uncharacterized protein LOC133459342 [Cololabis saira]
MGRRAADLTTPIPVLGVPALVGVRGWKTTGGDRSGGVLLQAWGLQCNIGVQTSPGISRPPTYLPDTLSDNVIQTSDGDISKETEEILLLTRSDNEKRAILKQKTGEPKIKKEVTFKTLGGDASQDVACHQRNSSGTYCYARAIKTNHLTAGTVTSGRPKLKSAARYTNGSVVDSEAIGGISVVNDEAEAVKGATSHGRGIPDHYADRSGKVLPLSAARAFTMPQKICNHCGGRQSITSRAAILGESSHAPDAYLKEKYSYPALTSLSTTTHFQAPCIEKYLQANQQISQSFSNTEKQTHSVNSQISRLDEEIRKTPHPACPVHSRGNLTIFSQAHVSIDATPVQPGTIVQAKTITVTKATIESRHADSGENCFAKTPECNEIPLHAGLALTPRAKTVANPNKPHSNIYPELVPTTHRNSNQEHVPQNVCVSVHAAPRKTQSPPYLYTAAMELGSTPGANMSKTITTFTSEVIPAESKVTHFNTAEETLQLLDKAQAGNATSKSPEVAYRDHKLSVSTTASDRIYKPPEPPAHLMLEGEQL